MTENDAKIVRGLGLCSGGLDSILSALVLRDQGVDVAWISFETPFFSADKAKAASALVDVPLIVEKITPVYMEMLKSPNAGYGKNMNPCMDCHTLMFSLAGAVMTEKGYDFLFSGEVLGQRPMSQNKSALRYVEKHSGYDGFIIRPLSAKRLPESQVEKSGLVNRDLLLDLSGRSRKPQIEMAKRYGVTRYPAPAGGCLLTDKGYARRLKDLLDHVADPSESDLELLKYGRHIRMAEGEKIIVGRTRQDNSRMLAHYSPKTDVMIRLQNRPGPVVLVPGGKDSDTIKTAAAICAGYSKAPADAPVSAVVTHPGGRETLLSVVPVLPDAIKPYLL